MVGEGRGGGTKRPTGVIAAYGWWPSPWSAAEVAAGKVSRSGLTAAGGHVLWTESRPREAGRQVVVGSVAGGPVVDLSPAGASVRSRVHEYGGGAATATVTALFYVDQSDQHWYRVPLRGDGRPEPLASSGTDARYADGRVTPSGRWLLSIEEDPGADVGRRRLVAVAARGGGPVVGLVEGRDFVAAPRPSPDGQWLAWVAWDHPSMPWDSSELWVAPMEEHEGTVSLGAPSQVAGGAGVSVGQAGWSDDGSLRFVDDRSGWWLPRLVAPLGWTTSAPVGVPLAATDAEFHAPDWILGQSTIAELADGSIVARMRRDGRDHLVHLRPGPLGRHHPGWTLEEIDQPCVTITGVVTAPVSAPVAGADSGADALTSVVISGSTPTEAHCVLGLPSADGGGVRRLSAPPERIPRDDEVSYAVPFGAAGREHRVPGLFYPPVAPDSVGPPGTRPPLVLFCHGGPTGAAEPGFDPVVQYFTSHGLAVAWVDYRGSAGYGRAYRRSLDGAWGLADVEDAAAFATALVDAGLVDGSRLAVRGTSAGGLTALGAVAGTRRFAGAVSWYGVTDLEALAAETHDFEARYLDSLVGPLPEASARYRERSPLRHPERISGAVLLLQGSEDPIVPVAQARTFAAALEAAGADCRLVVFEGESHGFRQAATIEAALAAELAFYRELFDAGVSPGA